MTKSHDISASTAFDFDNSLINLSLLCPFVYERTTQNGEHPLNIHLFHLSPNLFHFHLMFYKNRSKLEPHLA